MGKRKRILVVGLVVVIALSSFVVAYYWYKSTQIDTSWIQTVNNSLPNYPPYSNQTESNIEGTIEYCRVYLSENGTEQLIYYGNGGTLGQYLTNLLKDANIRIGSISETKVTEVLGRDKVVTMAYRPSVLMFGGQQRFYEGYFVLEDNLNEGLSGKIITVEVGKQGYSLWAISK